MGDFLGFTFGGVHSSDLGITRVSGGDRYEEQLHPEIKDRTAEVPGLNGNYYFGSDFGTKVIDIQFAFDCVTEEQFRKIRQIFGTKHIQELIFDERPYKYYMAKLESPIELSYVCFDEEDYTWEKIQTGLDEYVKGIGKRDFEYKKYNDKFRRIYKGEGKASFICHFPFAKSRFKQLSYQKTDDTEIHEDKTYYILDVANRQFIEVENPVVENLSLYYDRMTDEDSGWAVSSGILSVDEYQNYDTYTSNVVTLSVVDDNNETESISYNGFKVYNPGDLSTGFRLYCPFTAASQPQNGEVEPNTQEVEAAPSTYDLTVSYVDGTNIIHSLKIEGLEKLSDGDEGFLINTNNGLIEGVSNFAYIWPGNATYNTTGTIYNRFVTAGYFFKLQPDTELKSGSGNIYILLDGNNINNPQIFYDYLYF